MPAQIWERTEDEKSEEHPQVEMYEARSEGVSPDDWKDGFEMK